MKIEIIKDKLLQALSRVVRITTKHHTLPILSSVLVKGKKGQIVIRATNLDIGVEYSVPAKVEQEGAVVVPATLFLTVIANLGNIKSVELSADEKRFSISAGNTKAFMKTMPPDEFPTIPRAEGRTFSIAPSVLVKGFKSVQYAAAQGNLKPELGSVFVQQKNGTLFFAATDSFRLAEKGVPIKKDILETNVLVPVKNSVEIVRLLEEESDEVTVRTGKGQLSIETKTALVTSRLIEGVFPDYQQIIPQTFSTEVTALKGDVLSALKLTTLFSDRFSQLTVSADPTANQFELRAKNGDLGESAAKVNAAVTGERVEGNFNYRYIQDCISVMQGDNLVLRWSGENKPLVMSGTGDPLFRYLVMPMNR